MRPALIALGHLLVNDPAPGRHPLHVAGRDGAVIAHAVAVIHGSGQHVGDGLDAAMRMPGETGQIIVGNIVAEIVEKEKRIEIGWCCRNRTRAADARRRPPA